MNITLINAVRIAGTERAAGTTLTVDDALGADLVRRRDATDNNPPSFEVPVTARTSVTGGVGKLRANGKDAGLPVLGGVKVSLRDWNGYDDTGSNDIGSILQQAVTQLETYGSGSLQLEHGIFASGQDITVKGGAATLNGGYQGGISIAGSHMIGTKLVFSSNKGLILDCGAAPTHGNNSATAMISLRDMHIVGPGKAVAGSVGIDCGPQDNHQNTPNAVEMHKLWLDGFENLARFDDTTNLWVTWCYFLNYVKGLRFGYNHDTMSVMWNRFGDNQTVVGAQTETAMAWDYISPRFTGNTNLAGSQNHKIAHNWFMRQLLVADVWDSSASNITFEHNQFESCRHYAQLGNASVTQAPSRVVFEQNTFMRTDGQDETQAKFLFPNASAAGSLHLIRNVCDSATGPKYGWVQCGTGSIVEFDRNTLPTAGAYVVEANHLIVGASGKKVTLGSSERYTFNTVTGGKDKRQFNASGNDGSPDVEHWAYNATNNTIFQRWGNKAAGSESTSGTTFDMVQKTINGSRYALGNGGVIPLQGAALPSLGSDGDKWRGVQFLKQGAGGASDELYCCMKSAADTYAWKLVVSG